MRREFDFQLETLHARMIQMGALCEAAIQQATLTLATQDQQSYTHTHEMALDITLLERELEQICVRLLLLQQPIAGDLRQITAAQRILADMERIGDQTSNIAELALQLSNNTLNLDTAISEIAQSVSTMVTESIDSFVQHDLTLAQSVRLQDDTVDAQFESIKQQLGQRLTSESYSIDDCLDLLMIAKYFERIGDHAENIATWVIYAITGTRLMEGAESK